MTAARLRSLSAFRTVPEHEYAGVDLERLADGLGRFDDFDVFVAEVDCLIAACALRHDLEVLHRDRDFPKIARVSALRERAL